MIGDEQNKPVPKSSTIVSLMIKDELINDVIIK